MPEWTVRDPENDNERAFDSRADAEDAIEDLEGLGVDAELIPPSQTDGGQEADVVDVDAVEREPPEPTDQLDERSVAEDPLNWVPGEFVDEIDGTQAINRKGFEVLSHFYGVDVQPPEVMVNPHETDFQYCQVRSTAVTEDGRECSALGSAHVDRGDDPELLLEMADTRARKRALSIATGVGAVAVEELKNEMQ